MNAVIFGGGKIARGFIAQLLSRSGYHITFVEISEALVRALNEKGTYYVNVMGNPKDPWIYLHSAFGYSGNCRGS